MSEMDWELSSPPYIPQQNAGPGRCPYGQPANQTGNFPFSTPQPPSATSNVSYPPPPAPSHGFWENISQQNTQPTQGVSNRFNPMNTGPPPVAVRGIEINGLDYHMGLDGQPQSSSPSRPSRFEPTRPLVQRSRSHQVGMPPAGEPQGSLPVPVAQSSPPGALDLSANINGAGPRRNASGSAVPHENGSSNLPASPNRQLPPPSALYHGLFLPPNVPYARHTRYSADTSISNGPQGSVGILPPFPQQPPPWETSYTRAESGPAHPPPRNWLHEAFYTPQVIDVVDSDDDDSIDAQEDSIRRQGRLEPTSSFQVLHESVRVSSSGRRIANSFEVEGHELVLERSRAARRAAAAAVKFVASASALAALEKVDATDLMGDDKNCIICYNEFGVKNPDGFVECPVRLPKCKHVFGDRCLKQWLQDSDSCPYCRDKLPSEPKKPYMGDDVRRLIAAQTRSHGAEPWPNQESSRTNAEAPAGGDREQQLQLVQHRLERRDESADEILARIRRRDELDWASPFNQSSTGVPSRSIPDTEGRRRYRGRHNVSRIATQTAGRANGPTSTRSARSVNLQPNAMRTPIHGGTASFDENTTSQQRSITPHPTIVGTAAWSTPPQIQPATSGRPSSLPSTRSPLGEASNLRPDILNPRSPNGSNIQPVSPTDRGWLDNQNISNPPYNGWGVPIISNGRPASATFINELPQARLQHFHEDASGNPVPNNRLPPYHMNFNGGEFDPHTGAFFRR